jgi:hypothetical protein
MDNVYAIGSLFKKEDFKNVWSDAKNLIISTDYSRVDDSSGIFVGYTRAIMYFVVENNNPKLLSLNNFDGVMVVKNNFTEEEITNKLNELVLDSDLDGIPDVVENCTNPGMTNSCRPTDPNKRDTNGDGWWDSIDAILQ